MFPDEARKRQERLADEIYQLSKQPLDFFKEEHLLVIKKLQMIYKDQFKHSYSDFFPILLIIFDKSTEYSVDYLTNNLEIIRNSLEIDYSEGKNQYGDIYNSFTKLCDHLNLQISMLSNLTKTEERSNDTIKAMNEIKKTLEQSTANLKKANKKANSLQTELIAVLSIFAAIVITFSGGITFLGSVMASIKDVTYFESVILAAIICGAVIFNTIFLMMYMVSKITERNIFSKCISEECPCFNDNTTCNCSGLKKIRIRLPYVFYFNLAIIIAIIIDIIVWYLDIIEIII